ncbi:hypothetical protein KR200_001293, partial [Drosophila serrata]
ILAAVLGLILCQSSLAFGQVAVLEASEDDPKTPLIVLSNPISQSTIEEAVKSEKDVETTLIPELVTTYPPATDATATTEKVIKKRPMPPKQKPFLNHGQKQVLQLQDLLSLPGNWDSSPIVSSSPLTATSTAPMSPGQAMFYPMPVYIPYPIPFVLLNQPMQLMSTPLKDNVQDKIAMSFNEMMSGNLLRSSFQPDAGNEWHKIIKNRIKPTNQNGQKKWRGKWRKTTTTTTTTTTKQPEITKPTEPTRILLESSDNEIKSNEKKTCNETTEATK